MLGALIAICAVAIAAEDARAFFGSRGSCGSYGGSSGSNGSWGSRGSAGSYGSSGGLFRRGRGSWGSNGSYGSAGSAGSCGSYGGAAVSYYQSGGYYAARERAAVAPRYAVAESAPAAKTTLKLNVPADAKVTLAGVETKQSGEAREFSTSRLTAGQAWQNYTIHVEVERNGQVLAQDQTITLTGGTTQELSINFDQAAMQVAKL
jgi:uncharacterized protein (TIGR03000 family)